MSELKELDVAEMAETEGGFWWLAVPSFIGAGYLIKKTLED